MLSLVMALGITAQPLAKRATQRKGEPFKTMKQYAKRFADMQRKCKGAVTAKDLAKKAPARAGEDDADRWETLIYEDFSLMTKGTEDVPDETMYPEDYETTYNMSLPDELFHTPGWNGIGVYQAGGNLALNYPGFGGVLNSPMMNMQGRIRMQMRVKCIDNHRPFLISIAAGGYDYPFDPSEDGQMNLFNFEPEDGWQDIDVEVIIPYAGSDCFFQINAATYNNGGLIVDYVKVSRDKEYLATPAGLSASKFVTDGFTASWNKAYGADSYLVNLYETKTVGTDNGKYEESFEDASLNGGQVVGLGEGWSAKGTGDAITSDAADGGKAFLLSNETDFVKFEPADVKILAGKFAIKRVKANEGSYDEICVDVNDRGSIRTWIMNVSNISDDEYTTVDLEEFEDFPIGKASSITIYISPWSDVTDVYAIDALSFETTPLTETTCVAEGIAAKDTCLVLNELDLNNLYSFTVQSAKADGTTSEPSEVYYAYGVAAPVVKEATDIDPRGAYTANWEPAANATSYDLYSYEFYTVPSDQEDYIVFEENFNKCTEGTVENPVALNNYDPIYLNDYTDNVDWTGWGTLIANGMLGCIENFTDYLYAQSPGINVERNDGNYSVTVEFETFVDGTTLIIQGDETMYQELYADKAGHHTLTVEMTGGTANTRLMFYSLEGYGWLLDRVAVTQDVKVGDEIRTLLDRQTLDGDATSARVSGLRLKSGYKYGYNLVSYYDNYGDIYVSDPSTMQYVDFTGTGINTIETEDADTQLPTEIYDLSGRKVSKAAAKNGIYIIKSGDKVKKVRF